MAPQSKKTVADHDIESIVFETNDHGVEMTSADSERKRGGEENQTCCLLRLGKKCIFIGVLVVFLGATVAGLSIAFTGDPNPANYFIPVDPPGAKEAVRWNANAGLTLTLENACDESWVPYFDQSLLEWSQSDALTLSSQRIPHDPKCNPSRGRLKVCNGDYGLTEWKGLNTAVMSASSGFVVYSVSKLNDYHLKTDDDKAYTM